MTARPRFTCPPKMQPHAAAVFRGEYLVHGYEPSPGAELLDIGANVGAFTVWAHLRWPCVRLRCYEPHPSNFETLCANVVAAGCDAVTHCAAVFADGELALYEGKNNPGEHSLWRGREQTERTVAVTGVSPSRLPPCEFLKVDAEGAEGAILAGYPHLSTVRAAAVEFHSGKLRRDVRGAMESAGLEMVSEDMRTPEHGVQRFLRASASESK